ncbi:MAG: LPXTG cell wall anchor domain-containing protein [Lachnospiraceae bacterium]|nr:LPXTG cell wall anchor domain-containing protein [Lachnospiraceae bacterium]
MKKLFSFFTVVMMAVMSLNLSTLTVAAEEPTTYIVKYIAATEDWVYQEGSTWDDDSESESMYYMTLEMKDGDYVVVVAPEGNPTLNLDFHLGNLTIAANSSCTANVKSIKDCYILSGAMANINCDVTNGYLYDFSVCNFFGNCDNLKIYYTDDTTISVNVVGTCKDFYMHNDDNKSVKYQLYNFTTALSLSSGELKNNAGEYSTTPSAAPATPAAPSTGGNEYDDVPKTGQSNAFLFAFGLAAVCFLGSYSLKKRA